LRQALLVRNALVDRYEGFEAPRRGIEQRPIVQIAPAQLRRVTNFEANEFPVQPLRNARVEEHSRRWRCHWLRGNSLGEQRRLRHFENCDRVLPSDTREVHQEIVE